MGLVWVVIPLVLIGILGISSVDARCLPDEICTGPPEPLITESFVDSNLSSYKEGFTVGNVTVIDPSKTEPRPFEVTCSLFPPLGGGPRSLMGHIPTYVYSDLIVIGKVVGKSEDITSNYGNYTLYDIHVDKFLKNNFNIKSSTIPVVLDCPNNLVELLEDFENAPEMLLILYQKSEIPEYLIAPIPHYFPEYFTWDLRPSHQNELMKNNLWDYSVSDTIICLNDLIPIQKKSTDDFACVKPATAEKLMERDWTTQQYNTEFTGYADSKKIWIGTIPTQCSNPWDELKYLEYQKWREENTVSSGPFGEDGKNLELDTIQKFYEQKGATVFDTKTVSGVVPGDMCEACYCNAGGHGVYLQVSEEDLELINHEDGEYSTFESWYKFEDGINQYTTDSTWLFKPSSDFECGPDEPENCYHMRIYDIACETTGILVDESGEIVYGVKKGMYQDLVSIDYSACYFQQTELKNEYEIISGCKSVGGTWLDEHNECESGQITEEFENYCSDFSGEFDSCTTNCYNDICTSQCLALCEFD